MNDVLKARISELVPTMEGWASAPKALAMADLVLEFKPLICVELGVFAGRSLLPQAMALKELDHGIIYGVDPWRTEPCLEGEIGQENADWWANKVNLEEIHQLCMRSIWKEQVEKHAVVIRSTADQARRLFPKNSIGILHIDGCHSEVASCRDVQTYFPLVRRGGYIWFDDTNWESTHKAVSILAGSCSTISEVDNCRLFRKSQ